jgi:hypothetical protein
LVTNLSHNSLSRALPTRFFSSLNQLKILDLSYNYLGGDISLMLSSSGSFTGWPTSIQMLDMSSNNLSGTMQSSFFQGAWNLIKLNVGNNSFTGPIPSSFCINSPFVKFLDFSHNDYSGQIPNGLGRCSELKVFRAGFVTTHFFFFFKHFINFNLLKYKWIFTVARQFVAKPTCDTYPIICTW